jgi:Fur family ferric uptake transcriptional regulator
MRRTLVDVMARKQDVESIAKTRELLAKAGLRSTAARTAVLQWLQQAKAPATHAEVSVDLVPLGFDKATVFRNLNDLAEAGLVTRTELGDHVWRFELRDPGHAEGGQHPHFVCVTCGQVTCLHDLDLPKTALKLLARVGDVTEILVRGHCLACHG